jgi:hypothetical protein
VSQLAWFCRAPERSGRLAMSTGAQENRARWPPARLYGQTRSNPSEAFLADITLAEFNGSVWLVGGEAHLDDLLANTLPAGVSIELVACERKIDVHDMWVRFCGVREYAGDPWIIHPAIVQRVRGQAPDAAADVAVMFAPWSVMPDEDGQRMVRAAAARAAAEPEIPVTLTEYLDPSAPPGAAELSGLRMRMIEDALETAGLPRERVARQRRDTTEIPNLIAGAGRIDIITN